MAHTIPQTIVRFVLPLPPPRESVFDSDGAGGRLEPFFFFFSFFQFGLRSTFFGVEMWWSRLGCPMAEILPWSDGA